MKGRTHIYFPYKTKLQLNTFKGKSLFFLFFFFNQTFMSLFGFVDHPKTHLIQSQNVKLTINGKMWTYSLL